MKPSTWPFLRSGFTGGKCAFPVSCRYNDSLWLHSEETVYKAFYDDSVQFPSILQGTGIQLLDGNGKRTWRIFIWEKAEARWATTAPLKVLSFKFSCEASSFSPLLTSLPLFSFVDCWQKNLVCSVKVHTFLVCRHTLIPFSALTSEILHTGSQFLEWQCKTRLVGFFGRRPISKLWSFYSSHFLRSLPVPDTQHPESWRRLQGRQIREVSDSFWAWVCFPAAATRGSVWNPGENYALEKRG